MRVRYKAWREKGRDMTGEIADMDDEQAKRLIEANIVVKVEPEVEVETAMVEAPENAILKLNKKAKAKRR